MSERRIDSTADTVAEPRGRNPVKLEVDEADLASSAFGRYLTGALLGEGGMGKVTTCHDRPIGREVAMKVLTPVAASSPPAQARFLREARIQGQLEHPCIVPVYDLGATPDGHPFFTMKRVKGVTLKEVVMRLAAGDPEARSTYTRRRLLEAFSRVCLAVDAAHERGVIHRDIKPENIMLGNYGEVYLLDWGIAGLLPDSSKESTGLIKVDPELEHLTHAGQLLGTPQYMAPEQRVGIASEASDVYALGCVLYELLTLTKMQRSSSAREEGVPPELIEICRRATAKTPEDRYEGARALHAAVDRFLEGDRDLELRRRLADQHADRGAAAAMLALEGPDAHQEARSRALAETGRALALDPENQRAARTLFSLLAEPPRETPAAAAETWEEERNQATVRACYVGAVAWCAVLAFFPLALWMGVRDAWVLAGAFALQLLPIAAMGSVKWWLRFPRRIGLAIPIASATTASAAMCVFFGALVLVPALMAISAASVAMHVTRRSRSLVAAFMVSVFLVPLVLEWSGVIAPSYAGAEGVFQILPRAVELRPVSTMAFLTASSIALIVCSIFFFGSFREALLAAERRLHLQTWQLRQLLRVPDARDEAEGC
jgi:eukaryotic-like serine/threonine-protein kinase